MAGIIEFVASGVDCITARKHTSIYTCQLRLFITHGSMVYLLVSNHCLEAHRVLFSSSTRCSVSSLSLSLSLIAIWITQITFRMKLAWWQAEEAVLI